MNKMGVSLLWIVALPLVLTLLVLSNVPGSSILTFVVFAFVVICIFKPLTLPGRLKSFAIPGRGTAIVSAFALMFVMATGGEHLAQRTETELEALRTTDHLAYLQKLKTVDQVRWLSELKQTAPLEYLAALKAVDVEKWYLELEQLDPDTYALEKERRSNQAAAKVLVIQEKIAALEKEALGIPVSDVEVNLESYKELGELNPDEKRYQDKIAHYEHLVWQKRHCTQSEGSDAYIFSQDVVEGRLKAPRTAKFPFRDYSIRLQSDCVYVVSSYVDSQNGFGALIRTHWVVKIQKLPEGRWLPKDIQLGP